MTTTKKTLLAAALLAAIGATTPVWAVTSTFTFDPTGATNGAADAIANVATIDQKPGNALAVGGVTAIQNFISGSGSKDFTLLYQANLNTLLDSDGDTLFADLPSGPNFTFVAGFGETVLTAAALPGTATFGFNPGGPTNFFKMNATTASGNNLTGTGFAAGTTILEGYISSVQSSSFNLTDGSGTALLDQSGSDNWSGQKTVGGSGATKLTIKITSFDADYFPSFSASDIIFSFLNTSQVDPFSEVNPSKAFSSNGIANGDVDAFTSLGAVNGINGPNFIFQADANQSLAVPEPASLALMGLGLVGLGFAGRRRRT